MQDNHDRITNSRAYGIIQKIVRIALIALGILLLYVLAAGSVKLVKEKIRSYEDVEEIIEKNYKIHPYTRYIQAGDYYLIVSETIFEEGKWDVIKFEDNKYMTFDNFSKNLNGIGMYDTLDYDRTIDSTYLTVYSYDDKYIIVAQRDMDDEIVFLTDELAVWENVVTAGHFYYFRVIDRADISDACMVYAGDGENYYELMPAWEIEFSDFWGRR